MLHERRLLSGVPLIRGSRPRRHLGLLLLLLLVQTWNYVFATAGSRAIGPYNDAQSKLSGPLRNILQQPPALLGLIGDGLDDDPFASTRRGPFSALLPAQKTQQTVTDGFIDPLASSHPIAPVHHHHHHHHHHLARSNATHSWRTSPVLQIEIPQPWDSVNLSTIVRDNLEQDLIFWQQVHRQPTVDDILSMAKNHPEVVPLPNTRRLVEIRNNRLRFPLMPTGQQFTCDGSCDPQLQGFVEAMDAAVNVYNLTLPDVLFIINTDDAPICTEEQVMREACVAPVISLNKELGMADLVGPVMRRSDAEVVPRSQPWESKLDKAFFRGAPSCGEMPFPPRCARSWVARLSQVNHSQELDAGLVEHYDRTDQVKSDPVLQDGHGLLPVLPRVTMTELPKYKYLLNLDGHVAAYRLAQLLAMNSLVLKQESIHVEFYYRSLRAYHHYVPIFKHSEHDLISKLAWARRHEPLVKHIVANANHFAMKYTSYKARVLYWKYVLIAYRKLIVDMDDYFAKSQATGTQMEYMLKSLVEAQLPRLATSSKHSGKILDENVSQRVHDDDSFALLAGMDDGEQLLVPEPGVADELAALAGDAIEMSI